MRIYKKSIAWYTLLILEKTVDGYCRFEDFTYHHYKYQYGIPNLKKSSLSHALKIMRERGLIELEKDQDKILVKLTELGKDALINLNGPAEDWDGKWRLVMFDIPENKRLIRDLLRRRLRDWEFRLWQRSVWISKRDVALKLRKLISKLGIEDWVVVVESNDKAISKIYNL